MRPVALAAIVAVGTYGAITLGLRSGGQPSTFRGTVTHVADGDTLRIGGQTIRLLGVDTPETHDPRKPVQCYGPQAAAFTTAWATGQPAIARTEDSSGDTTDRYGRTIAYVTVHHRDLGATLLRRGYATVYAFGGRQFKKLERYERLERVAREQKRGRWGACP